MRGPTSPLVGEVGSLAIRVRGSSARKPTSLCANSSVVPAKSAANVTLAK